MFVTYLTIYSGEKLPPFYIGSTYKDRLGKGYHGSVKSKKYQSIWENEIKSNPHLFETRILSSHADREDALKKEEEIQKLFDVVRSPLFINMAYARGGFIKPKGPQSQETREKISKAVKAWFRGETIKEVKSGPNGCGPGSHSEETKRKMSESHKAYWAKMSIDDFNKIMDKRRKPWSEETLNRVRTKAAEKKALKPPPLPKDPKPKKIIDFKARGIKIGNALRGRKMSEEAKKKMRVPGKGKGRKQTPEQIAKRMASRKQTLLLKKMIKENNE